MKKIFNSSEYNILNESHIENKSIVEAFLKIGDIRMRDGSIHNASEFVNIVNSALMQFKNKHPWEYKYIQYARIIYLLDGLVTNTMAVDERGDLYINVEFIYSYLKMNVNYIMYILYHEAMHNILNHVERGKKYGKNSGNKLTWEEMNKCADFEVNGQMVADHVCKAEDWFDLKGCYDPDLKGLTFEIIANLKNKLKNIDNDLEWDPTNGGNQKKGQNGDNDNNEKSPDYKRGYDKMKKAISDLLAKNNGDKEKTQKDLTDIYSRTKQPDTMLSEIENLLNEPKTHFIMNSQMFESAETDAEWINGLKDGFTDGLKQLYDSQKHESDSNKSDSETDEKQEENDVDDANDKSEKQQGGSDNEKNKNGSKQSNENGETEKDNKTDANDSENGSQDSSNNDETDSGQDTEKNGSDDSSFSDKTKHETQPTAGKGNNTSNEQTTDDTPSTDISGVNSMVGRIVKQSELETSLADSLKNSGYDNDDINSIRDELISRPYASSQDMSTLREQIISNKKNSVLADLCSQVNVEENVMTELWEELVKKFLERTTTRRGSDSTVEDEKDIRWGNKRYLSMDDIVMPYHGKTSAAPQYINIFIDCSGSINTNICLYFLGIIENICKKLDFSGLRLIPFSDRVEESKIVGCTQEELKDEKTLEMLRQFIYECEKHNYGGGGNDTSFICMANHIHKCDIAEPESVYLVMTDGGLFDTRNIIKFKYFSERVLFCITGYHIKDILKGKNSYLNWCVDPKYSFLDKVYIDLYEVDGI